MGGARESDNGHSEYPPSPTDTPLCVPLWLPIATPTLVGTTGVARTPPHRMDAWLGMAIVACARVLRSPARPVALMPRRHVSSAAGWPRPLWARKSPNHGMDGAKE